MTQSLEHPAVQRIEKAVARIEKAAGARAYSAEMLARRHAALRTRMEEAVEALDALIAREDAAAPTGEPR